MAIDTTDMDAAVAVLERTVLSRQNTNVHGAVSNLIDATADNTDATAAATAIYGTIGVGGPSNVSGAIANVKAAIIALNPP